MSSKQREAGFTLVELMVALGLLMLVMVASLPAFLGMLRSSVSTRMQTQAKNLSQQRLEQLKDLRFHIDRQNGPFLDLLDIYYTNADSSAATTLVTVDGTATSGKYVTSPTGAREEPAVPYFRVTSSKTIRGKVFDQTVYAQFLRPDGRPLSMAPYQGVYDSQVVGKDAAPSTAVAITVVTNWIDGPRSKYVTTRTRITDGRPQAPVIQTQARAVAVQVTSTAVDGTTLDLKAGVASADGSQSTGSAVSGFATGASAARAGAAPATGKAVYFSLPDQAVSTVNSAGGPQAVGPGCASWFTFGGSDVANGTGGLPSGLPRVPANVDSTTPVQRMAGFLLANGGGACGLLSYDNVAGGGVPRSTTSADALGYEMGPAPYVRTPDGSGSGAVITGSVYVVSSAVSPGPLQSTSGAAAQAVQPVVIFPNNPESGGRGLVSLRLLSSSLTCNSGTTSGAPGTATASYTFELGWWGRGPTEAANPATAVTVAPVWHTATWTYSSGGAPVRTGPAWDPANTYLGNGTRLSDLIASPAQNAAPAVMTEGATSGLRGFNQGIFSLTTTSTLLNETQPGYSAIKVAVGQLTCVADDQR